LHIKVYKPFCNGSRWRARDKFCWFTSETLQP